MSSTLPASLTDLLSARPAQARDLAWEEFLRGHSRLLMYVARSFGGDYDATMDRYATLLDQLSRDDFRKLRAFANDGRSDFTTWLVVVAQRICVDHRRSRYGRSRETDGHRAAMYRVTRRRLADLVGIDVDDVDIPATDGAPADEALVAAERERALESALAELPAHDRLLIELRFRDELSVARIATLVGQPTRFYTYRRLEQALTLLRRELAARGIDRPDD